MISRRAIQTLEAALYGYLATRDTVAAQREAILYGTPRHGEGRQAGRISDTTGQRGIKLAELAATDNVRWVDCITDALKIMPESDRHFVTLRYFEQRRMDDIAKERGISRSWCYIVQEQILRNILLLATQRGIIKPIDDRRQGA